MNTRGGHVDRLKQHWPKTPMRDIAEEPEPEKVTWTATAKSWEQILEDFMAEHPRLTVLAALAIGVYLGWLVKRK